METCYIKHHYTTKLNIFSTLRFISQYDYVLAEHGRLQIKEGINSNVLVSLFIFFLPLATLDFEVF